MFSLASAFEYLAFYVPHSGNEETVKTSGSLQRTEGENIDGKRSSRGGVMATDIQGEVTGNNAI